MNKKRKIWIFLIFIFLFQISFAYAQEADIKKQSNELSKVRKTIKQKNIEKDRLVLQEKVFKRELKSLNDAIEKNQNKLNQISKDIKNAENNLEQASRTYNKAFEKHHDWNQAMLDEIELYNKMIYLVSYEQNPVEYKIRQEALKYKKDNFDREKHIIDISSLDIKKWEKAKSDLLVLRKKENKLVSERKDLIKEKNTLLKRTSSARSAAEKEIKQLNESEKALQALIKKLTEASKQKQAQQKESVIRTPSKAKKSLPWPVDGKIILQFGKNKHPELDTYIISNGIKIKAVDFSQVKSIDSGEVVFTGEFRSYGKVIIVDHKDSCFGVYGQLSQILVKEAQRVSKGTVLGKLGKGSESVLYFEIRQDNIPDNPLLWLQAK